MRTTVFWHFVYGGDAFTCLRVSHGYLHMKGASVTQQKEADRGVKLVLTPSLLSRTT